MGDRLAQVTGERVRSLRLRHGKSQTVVAGLAGISTDYLYEIERGSPTRPGHPTRRSQFCLQTELAQAPRLGISFRLRVHKWTARDDK